MSARALANQVRNEFHPNFTNLVVELSYFRSSVRAQTSAMNVLVLLDQYDKAARPSGTMASNGLPWRSKALHEDPGCRIEAAQ